MSVKVIRFAPGLRPVIKHQEHDQSSHGNWADSGSPKLTIMGQNDGTNEFFNENTRVVRYQPKGEEPVDYVIFNSGQSEIFAFKKPTDGTTINGYGYGPNSPKPVARLDVAGPGATAYRSSASKDNNATIAGVIVNASHRRRGLASAMLRFHRDMYPELNVQHSDALLDDGKAWSDVTKHEQHDQATHGSWANGTSESSLISTDTQIAFNEGAIKATDNILSPSAYQSQLEGNLNRTYPKTYLEEAVNNPAYQDALQTHLKSIGFPETVKVFSNSAQEGEYFHGSVAPLWDSGAVGYESEEPRKEFSVNRSDIIGLGKVADSGVWFRNAKEIKKHLQGQHDQQTHGRWADSGLPHELEDMKGSLQKYFDAGAIAKKGEVTRQKRSYEPREDGTGYDYVTTRVPAPDTLDQPFMTVRAPYNHEDPEGYEIFQQYEEKMLGGNYDEIKGAAEQEALDAGMGSRQALYYGQAIASRASLYVTMHNEAIRQEAAEKVYSREFGEYQSRFGMKDYFEQRAKTMKTLSENVSKAQPVVAIETEDFLGVIKDGRFKTQHETRESNGAYKPALRKEAELAIAGVPLDTKSSERPIYGYLAVQNDGKTANTSPYNSDKWNVNNTGVGQYGEVRVVLKDSVRERTSYTIPDSLDRNAIPQPLGKNSKTDLIKAGAYYDLSQSHGGYQRESYAEAQVYGGVKLSDIKAVYVVPSKSYDDSTRTYTPRDHVAQANSIRAALTAKGFDTPVEVLPLPKKEG